MWHHGVGVAWKRDLEEICDKNLQHERILELFSWWLVSELLCAINMFWKVNDTLH